MKYLLLKELPFLKAGTTFERMCKDSEDCCVFGVSFHNCVKHYDTMQFSENENKILCSIIDNPEWILKKSVLDIEHTAREAVDMYDSGDCTRDELIQFIEDY